MCTPFQPSHFPLGASSRHEVLEVEVVPQHFGIGRPKPQSHVGLELFLPSRSARHKWCKRQGPEEGPSLCQGLSGQSSKYSTSHTPKWQEFCRKNSAGGGTAIHSKTQPNHPTFTHRWVGEVSGGCMCLLRVFRPWRTVGSPARGENGPTQVGLGFGLPGRPKSWEFDVAQIH